jgi:hypothetical protein
MVVFQSTAPVSILAVQLDNRSLLKCVLPLIEQVNGQIKASRDSLPVRENGGTTSIFLRG